VFKLSKMTDYGVVVLSYMANSTDKLMTSPDLAERTTLPAPTVAKILKLLARADVVTATRGAQGGYQLDRDPTEISVAEVISALEGPVALTACVDGSEDSCAVERLCPMAGGWDTINSAVKSALDGVSLADLIEESSAIPPAFRLPADETAKLEH